MGNQPSAPPQTPDVPSTAIPPLPPPCDLKCQRDKKLVSLKQALDSTDPTQDPAGYEKARIAYYTLLNGPGWLAQEKNQIASQDVEPVLKSYQQQYDSLKGEDQSQGVFKTLADSLKTQAAVDQQSNQFLNKQRMSKKDEADVANRLNQLSPATPVQTTNYMSWLIDILITILGLFVAYKLYTKIASRFSGTSTPVLSSV